MPRRASRLVLRRLGETFAGEPIDTTQSPMGHFRCQSKNMNDGAVRLTSVPDDLHTHGRNRYGSLSQNFRRALRLLSRRTNTTSV